MKCHFSILIKNLLNKQLLFFALLLLFSTQMQSQTFCPDDVGTDCDDCPTYSVTANPDLSISCQGSINVVLVIDESNSIGNANAEQDVEDGVDAFLQELACTPVNVAIIEFGSVANYVVNSYTPVNNVIAGMNNYFDGVAYNGQTYNPDQGDLGGTNWQAGLMLADALAVPDLLLVFTDGVPTAWTPDTGNIGASYDFCGSGNSTQEAEIYNAVQVANNIKSEGTHMFILGVGGVSASLMNDISDDDEYGTPSGQTIATADFYIDQGFNTLSQCFASLANSLCPIAASVQGSTICEGDSNGTIEIDISLSVPTPYTITVNNGTPIVTSNDPVILTGLVPGNYDIKVEAAGTCFGEGNYNVDVLAYPVTPDDTASGEVCEGELFNYEGTDYAVGSYDIPRVDGNGCPYKTVLTVTAYPITPDDSQTVEVCSGATYSYEGQEYGTGSYPFEMTDNNGCPYTFTLIVEEIPLPDVEAGPNAEIDCAITEVQLNGSSSVVNASYLWTTLNNNNIVSGANTLTPTVNATGIYTLTVTDLDTQCSASDIVEVVAGPGVFEFEIVCNPKINVTCPDDIPEPDIGTVGVPEDGNTYIVEYIEDVYIIGEPGCGEAAIKRFYEVTGPCQNTIICEQVILVDYEAGLVAPPNGELTVNCPDDVITPQPPVIMDSCDVEIQGELVDTISDLVNCDGTVEYLYRYTNCDGAYVEWSFIYTVETEVEWLTEAMDMTVECGPGQTGSCTYYIQLFDSFGDGWQGDTVDVLVNGNLVLEDQTLADQFGGESPIPGEEDPRPFAVETGDAVITIYHEGDYPNEVSWIVTDSEGEFVAEGNASQDINVVADCEVLSADAQFEAWRNNWGGATVDPNSCTGLQIVGWSEVEVIDGCGETGSYTFDFVAEDNCGNQILSRATFNIIDTTAPEFTYVPETANLECDDPDPTVMATAVDSCSDDAVVVTYEDYYEHTPWQALTLGGNGSVDFTNLPNGFSVTGSNTGTFNNSYLTVGLTTAKNVILSFDWIYSNETDTAQWDAFVYYINGEQFTILGSGTEGADSLSVELSAGDVFAIGIFNPSDDCCGPGIAEISNINWQINNECPVTKCFIREFTATDACGNTSTARQNVIFRDTEEPVQENCFNEVVTLKSSQGADCPEDADFSFEIGDTITINSDWSVAGIPINQIGSLETCFSDNCTDVEDLRFVITDKSSDFDGCSNTLTVTFDVLDLCGNAFEGFVCTFIIEDDEAPVISTHNVNQDLGCNPEVIPPLFTATDNCDELIPIVSTEGPMETEGCGMTQTWTANVEDGCGNEAIPVSITYTWTEDYEIPVILSDTPNSDLGCNPDVINAPNFTATDNCSVGEVSVYTNGPGYTEGCGMSQTWTANVSDACGNPADELSITLTWTIDTELPVITSNSQDADLGCNPEIVPPLFKVEDNCLATEMDLESSTEGPQTSGGCGMTQTWTATYTDACGNIAIPLSVTYTWIEDSELPVITSNSQNADLGCNPEIVPPLFKVEDNCLSTEIDLESSTDGPLQTEGCGMTQTWTATYTDACGNIAIPLSITYNWIQDTENPVILTINEDQDLGCNPDVIETPQFKVYDNCLASQMQIEPETEGPISDGGCSYSQTWTVNYTDACGNQADQVSITYVWTIDNEVPVITSNGNSGDLGCNPDFEVPLFKADDNCSGEWIPLEPYTEGPQSTKGCGMTQTWTATYTDLCGNEAIPLSVTYTWTQDNEVPVITSNGNSGDLGCNPEIIEVPLFKADDNCSEDWVPLEPYTDGPVTTNGCEYSQTWTATYTDPCGNEAVPLSITYTWIMEGSNDTNQSEAFARFEKEESVCFMPEFSRWGWSNFLASESDKPYELKLYYNSDVCSGDERSIAGKVEVYFNNGSVTVQYIMNEGYSINSSSTYVGCQEFPFLSNGNSTVNPSRYNFISPPDGNSYSNFTVGPIDASNADSVYVIACAQISEVECTCSISSQDISGIFSTDGSAQCRGRNGGGGLASAFNFRASQGRDTEELNVNFELDIDSKVKVDILNMNGVLLKSQVIHDYKKGTDETMLIDTSRIRDRVLFVRVTTDQGSEVKKIILNRK